MYGVGDMAGAFCKKECKQLQDKSLANSLCIPGYELQLSDSQS